MKMPNRILQHFKYENVKQDVSPVRDPFIKIAHLIDETLENSPEKTIALNKLLEACDATMRAWLMDKDNKKRDSKIEEVREQLFPSQRTEEVKHG